MLKTETNITHSDIVLNMREYEFVIKSEDFDESEEHPKKGHGMIHSASAYPRLQARVKRTIAYTPTDDGTAGFPTVCDSFN